MNRIHHSTILLHHLRPPSFCHHRDHLVRPLHHPCPLLGCLYRFPRFSRLCFHPHRPRKLHLRFLSSGEDLLRLVFSGWKFLMRILAGPGCRNRGTRWKNSVCFPPLFYHLLQIPFAVLILQVLKQRLITKKNLEYYQTFPC